MYRLQQRWSLGVPPMDENLQINQAKEERKPLPCRLCGQIEESG